MVEGVATQQQQLDQVPRDVASWFIRVIKFVRVITLMIGTWSRPQDGHLQYQASWSDGAEQSPRRPGRCGLRHLRSRRQRLEIVSIVEYGTSLFINYSTCPTE